jgi:Kdo2-lipid IVA lauroyltransferase/acyltransferase
MQKKSHIAFRIIYVICLIYFFLGRLVPLRLWVYLGKIMGKLLYLFDSKHRRIALNNLRFALGPEKTEKEIHIIARRSLEEFGMIAHEWSRLKYIRKEELRKLIEVEGMGNLIAARRKNQAVILFGAHFGNWEYANLFYATDIHRLDFIVRAIDNPFLERVRVTYNTAFGVNILYKQKGLRPAIKNLKNGEDLIMFVDQKVSSSDAILVRFFDKTTATTPLVPAISLKYNLPIIPMFILRCEDRILHKIIFLPELKLNMDLQNQDQIIADGTQRQNDIIESMIRQHPQQWLWLHRKWSTHYPELYE